MQPTARHILELALILAACRLGGIDLGVESAPRKGTIAALVDDTQQPRN